MGASASVALVRSLDEERLDDIVPLNPEWRVRDVVAHLVGVCEDSLARNFPDFSDPKEQPQQARDREAWTQAQVERRRDRPIDALLDEWDALGRQWEEVLGQDPAESGYDESVRTSAPFDIGCHLHDLRHAVHEPGDRDVPTTAMAFAARSRLARAATRAGWAAGVRLLSDAAWAERAPAYPDCGHCVSIGCDRASCAGAVGGGARCG